MRARSLLAVIGVVVVGGGVARGDVVSEELAVAPAAATTLQYAHVRPLVAVHEGVALVAWLDTEDFGGRRKLVRAQVVNLSDASFDPPGLVLTSERHADAALSSVVWAGDTFLVFFSDGEGRFAARVHPSGRLLDVRRTPVEAAVASDGSSIVAVDESHGHLFATAVDPLGLPLAQPGERIVAGSALRVTDLVHDGSSFVVFYADVSADVTAPLRALRLGSDGRAIGAELVLPVPRSARAASDGSSGTLLTWESGAGPYEVRCAQLDTADVVGDTHVLATGDSRVWTRPTSTAVRDGYVVLYDFFDAYPQTLAVSDDGLPAASPETVVTRSSIDGLAIAGVDRAFLAFEGTSGRLDGIRYGETGVRLDEDAFAISVGATSDRRATVAYGGTAFLVGWARAPRNPARDSMRVARVHPTGVVDPHREIGAGHGLLLAPLDGGYVAIWDDPAASPGSVGGGYPVRRPLDAAGVPTLSQSGHQAPSGSPYALASRGSAYLVGWTAGGMLSLQSTPGATVTSASVSGGLSGLVWTGTEHVALLDDAGLTFVRADASGIVTDATPRRIASGSPTDISVAAGGGVLGAAWIDGALRYSIFRTDGTIVGSGSVAEGGATYAGTATSFDGADFLIAFGRRDARGEDVAAIRVTTAATASAPFDVAASPEPEDGPAIGSDGAGRSLVAYSRVGLGGARTLHARFVRASSAGETGSACASASECTSGFCVDGVCCESACGGGVAGDCQGCSVREGASVDGRCDALPAGSICRPSSGLCDAVDACDGASAACPSDVGSATSTICDDGDPCTFDTTCQADATCAGTTVTCADGSTCDSEMCCGSFTTRCADDGDPCFSARCDAAGCARPLTDEELCAVLPDAGMPDAGARDAGPLADGGTPRDDAGPVPDAEPADGASPRDAGSEGRSDRGCGCAVPGASRAPLRATFGFALALAWSLAALRRRRRRA